MKIEFISRILNRLKLLSIVCSIVGLLKNRQSKILADEGLNNLHQQLIDGGGSCIADKRDKISIEYDLQIIVPVYNVEKYLDDCLQSIVNQKTKYKILVCVVNDGSTDSSGQILKKYQYIEGIEIFNQNNRGLSGARNAALNKLRAEYIMFVDSDDYLIPDSLEILMDRAYEGSFDIVQGSWIRIDNTNKQIGEYRLPNNIDDPKIIGFPWGKVYKSQLFSKICFPEGYWFEDTLISRIIFKSAKKICTISNAVYAYRKNIDSISQRASKNIKIIDTVYITKKLLEDQKKLGILFEQVDYDSFLKQIAVNQIRLSTYGNKEICESSFAVHRSLREEYYGGFRTNNKALRGIEKALLTGNFLLYRVSSGVI